MQVAKSAMLRPAASRPRFAPFVSSSRNVRAVAARASFKDTPPQLIKERGELTEFPSEPGVYAVYDPNGNVQFIGLSRKIATSVSTHMQELPDLTYAVKVQLVPSGTREDLTATWKEWVEEAVEETGKIPPGNAPGETKWQSRSVARATKPEIRLTAGKAINVPVEKLIDQVVKDNKVVAFIKGTRQQPQCGFSFKMLNLLNTAKADYEVVNVLDDFHNPGLRDAIKGYSQWPTIPQLYVKGEFVGGADIVEELSNTGELQQLIRQVQQA